MLEYISLNIYINIVRGASKKNRHKNNFYSVGDNDRNGKKKKPYDFIHM